MGHERGAVTHEIEQLRREIVQNPNDVRRLLRLGALLYEPAHSVEEAVAVLRHVIDLELTNVDARLWLGLVLRNEAFRFGEGRGVLQEAVALQPDRADCLDLLAELIREDGGQPAEYLDLLERAVEAAPDWVLPRVHLAQALRRLGRTHEAADHLRRALVNDGSVPEPADPVQFTYEWEVTGRLGSRGLIESLLSSQPEEG